MPRRRVDVLVALLALLFGVAATLPAHALTRDHNSFKKTTIGVWPIGPGAGCTAATRSP